MVSMDKVVDSISSIISNKATNNYSLIIDEFNLTSELSILSLEGSEILNQPWQYIISFTCQNKQIDINSVLTKAASLTFHPRNSLPKKFSQFSEFVLTEKAKTLYGVITEFSLLSISKDEARYQVRLEPRLALLANHHQSAIYQNQSVIDVVEEVLRNHGFTGIDYRLELKDAYPIREFITQWQESDLTFIQRLLADVGIWFRFETHPKHNCDVVVISDYEQGYENAGNIALKPPSGMNDSQQKSIWNLQFSSRTKPKQVSVNDYNYRSASSNLHSTVNSQSDDSTTQGDDYHYEEHYKTLGDKEQIESGNWYANIRHQQHLSDKLIISGECSDYRLAPGQHILIEGCPINNINDGIIILSIQSHADRTQPYQTHFTAIPYDALKPYRPEPLSWPQVSGTLPGRITSPDNDTYGYIDTKGRYRVKLNFDLKSWKPGEESLWMRLAKPYSGATYGFHFPLIDGTEVAIAFTNGNPDRPYIAHAMHDSANPDHVSTANKHRNVIRTPANNKLRMDDKRGKEHIKLATEYGKTQLNIGHLVDSEKVQRGEGFELRTDEWGAIAANKGLYLTAKTEAKAKEEQLEMQSAINQLNNALSNAKALFKTTQNSQTHPPDVGSQEQLLTAITMLKEAGILLYAPDGIALTSDKNIQLSSGNTITTSSEQNIDLSAQQNITLSAEKAISLFAHKAGMKLFANQGKVEIQAQNNTMEIAAKKDIKIDSVDGNMTITAGNTMTFICGGSYIKLSSDGIELGSKGNVLVKSNVMQKMGPATLHPPVINLPNISGCNQFFILTNNKTGQPLAFHPYNIEVGGKIVTGITDANGRTQRIFTDEPQTITCTPEHKSPKNTLEVRHLETGKRILLNFNKD